MTPRAYWRQQDGTLKPMYSMAMVNVALRRDASRVVFDPFGEVVA